MKARKGKGGLRDHIRVDLNQEFADCMNVLDDRLNDYFCHEPLPFLCEFTLPGICPHSLLPAHDSLTKSHSTKILPSA